MSKTYTYNGEHSWNYLGRFYGIDPTVLAAFNGQRDVKLSAPIPKGFKLQIPDAASLTKFYPEFRKIFPSMSDGPINLSPPTMVRIERQVSRYPNLRKVGQGSTLGLKEPIVASDGNMIVVNAARMRRFGNTGENYEIEQPLRSLNPNHEGNRAGPDRRALAFTSDWFKCNVFVGDTLFAAGYDWPMSNFKRYLQPPNLLQWMAGSNPYATPIWVAPHFADGKEHDEVPLVDPTLSQLAGVQPGDVLLLHAAGGGLPGHSAIVSSHPQLDEDGKLVIRVIDIYGEQWIRVDEHRLAAVVRPKKKNFSVPEQASGGDPNKLDDYLDRSQGEAAVAPSDAYVEDELWLVASPSPP